MEQVRGAAAAAHGDVLDKKGAETASDAVQEVTCVGGAGDAATALARSLAAAADLEEKGVASSDSAVPDLEVKVSSGALPVRAEAGDEQVVEEEDVSVDKKRKLDLTGFDDPYDPSYGDDEVYGYDSGDDVDHNNVESFIAKEVQKIKDQGSDAYYKREKFRCPYCTKPKPRDGLFEHLMSHARDASRTGEDQKIRAQHAALLKALYPM